MKKLLSLGLAVLCLLACLTACTQTSTSNSLDEYMNANVPVIHSEFDIFPARNALDLCVVNNYRYVSKSTLFFDDLYFLLSCTYTPEQYETELLRLQQTGAEYENTLFSLPAYVMLFSGKCYEYALLDEEHHTVIYVYAQTGGWEYLDDFPAEYLPKNATGTDICKYSYLE